MTSPMPSTCISSPARTTGSSSSVPGSSPNAAWLFRRSGWNRAVRAGKITVHRLDPATHFGSQSYISPTAQLPDGRSHLDRTADTVIAIIRAHHSATVAQGDPLP